MAKSTVQIRIQRDKLVAWSGHNAEVYDLVKSGVSRRLYPQVVADLVIHYLDMITDIETDNLMDMVEDATKEQNS